MFFEEPHRDPSSGKIIIENNDLYYKDVSTYGAYQAQQWVQAGKYNLSPAELEKERLRQEEHTLTLYELSGCLSDADKVRLEKLKQRNSVPSSSSSSSSNTLKSSQEQKEIVIKRIEKLKEERLKRDEEIFNKQREKERDSQLHREHEEYVKSLGENLNTKTIKTKNNSSHSYLGEKATSKKKAIDFDNMDGHEFEAFCAKLLEKNGFDDVTVTQGSGDQGIDILAYRDDIKYGFQCKCYSSPIGNHAVQEVFAGKSYYQCHIGIVLTNNYFTNAAKELAKRNQIVLWNRDKLLQLIQNSKD